MPKNSKLPGIILELKAAKNTSKENLKKMSAAAFAQIEDRKYDTEMLAKGVNRIYKYGVAFSGKHVDIAVREE